MALQLLDEQGLAALQMRVLAKRLDVQASALYWHVHTARRPQLALSYHP